MPHWGERIGEGLKMNGILPAEATNPLRFRMIPSTMRSSGLVIVQGKL